MTDKKSIGKIGEDIAAKYLTEQGFDILERNYFYGHGEIDIVAMEGEDLVFVEVKTRRNREFGDPEYAITPAKQRQIRKIAEAYLYERDVEDTECRFDVIAIITPDGKKLEYFNHLKHAFEF
ncbi:MAG: YraN family protein [Melioribacteraceae bacterium]|nr:YraN family protein [Melioribacteraceae bacterium]MCF8355053.1 YraN family protein [Melioribacteraceae bacterium]MCF8395650.1 YraN family protein [Melioribacteraceae bacterium]MCF8420271.1 YraN family protein [Melioribacteraceae bacterium]